ncbi:MAG: DUF502 domain-containing protein [Alphaproteobacteria bacterium]|nr:DUF502 domain-containing protein [Alphaproteobacteria bacterium]
MARFLTNQLRILLAGLLAVLPLMLTIGGTIWVGTLLIDWAGPQSAFGNFLATIGLAFVPGRSVAYLVGFLIVILSFYLVGLQVASRLRTAIVSFVGRVMERTPLIGAVYGLLSRFVGAFGKQGQADTSAMAPVWCFFGGVGGVAVLALLSVSEAVEIGGKRYLAVLVPTAPVPFGGGLLFVPDEWVTPAAVSAEALTSIYVSMGMTAPQFLAKPVEAA